MQTFERNFIRYTDAGLPILYVDTFEDDKAREIIHKLCRQYGYGRDIIEWNLSGARDFSDGQIIALPKMDLAETLNLLIGDEENLDNKTLVLQDAHFYLDKPETISAVKTVAQGIETAASMTATLS